jgi:hypothetical protein
MLNEKQIREYYMNAKLWLPEDHTWRLFKIRDCDGRVFNLPQISSEESLRALLVLYAPIDVWYSQACWYDPTKVRKDYYSLMGENFLFSDIFIDFDKTSKNQIIHCLELIKTLFKELKLHYILKTSEGNHQVVFKLRHKTFYGHYPHERVKRFQTYTNHLIKDLKIFGINADWDCTIDPYRVIRLPNTLRRSGFVTTLYHGQQDFVDGEKRRKSMNTVSRPRKERKEETLPRSPFHHVKYKTITNKFNKDHYIPFLTYTKIPRMHLTYMQYKYNLGTLYIIHYGDYVGIVSV